MTHAKWFQVRGTVLSFRDKKTVYDVYGAPVLIMEDKILTLMSSIHILTGTGQPLCDIKKNFQFFEGKLHASVPTNLGPVQIVCRSDIRSKAGVIAIGDPNSGGRIIGKIYRPTNARHLFGGVQDYFLTIAPGVDAALMIAFCIALDEFQKD